MKYGKVYADIQFPKPIKTMQDMVTRLSHQSPGTSSRAQGSNLELGTQLSPKSDMTNKVIITMILETNEDK